MGYNTTVVVMNDALGSIKIDPHFGRKLYNAILDAGIQPGMCDVSAGPHCNAATVITCNHADTIAIVAVGGNMGEVLSKQYNCGPTNKEKILREMADEMGFVLHKKPKRK